MEQNETINLAGPSQAGPSYTQLHDLQPEIIIIGAGIAGSALAYSLTHAGRKVCLIERDLSEPDRIVGELLQPGGVAALQSLGLGGCLDGIDAVGVEGYCVISGDRQVGIPYPALEVMAGQSSDSSTLDLDTQEKANGNSVAKWHVESGSGKKEGRSFHHGRLISALRRKCMDDAPGLIMLEATVRDLVFCEHTDQVVGVTAALKTSTNDQSTSTHPSSSPVVMNIYAPITIIADGCFSKFRTKSNRVPTPKTRSHFVGLILKDVDLPMPRHGTVCLTPNGPVLLYQIADQGRETRMLVDVKGKLRSVGDGSLKNHIISHYLPYLPSTIQAPLKQSLEAQRLRTMPNSFLPPSMQGLSNTSLRGAILVGDAWNMRHPLTGGGMTVAFNDAVLLTEYLKPQNGLPAGREGLENWEEVSERLREWFWERKKLSSVVNILSMALYDLFGGADHQDLEVLREGCFRYFELGGDCVAGPVGLLSALTPRPIILFYHFFSVALYSIYILLTQGLPPAPGSSNALNARKGYGVSISGVLDVPFRMVLSVRVFWTACVVLLPVIWSEIKI